jgi:hypothetical protein
MPGRTTSAWAWFMHELTVLEPGTVNSGTYTNKAGYHNSRANLLASAAWRNDYSIRSTVDKQGPSDAGAAGDWTFRDAQAGKYFNILKYMDRIEAAFHARDPRLDTWREVLGQADLDLYAEGFDFDSWGTRTPDSTHVWHIHLSEHRAHTESFASKTAMLSVLRGESLADWKESMALKDSAEFWYLMYRQYGMQTMQDPIVIPFHGPTNTPERREPNLLAQAIRASGGISAEQWQELQPKIVAAFEAGAAVAVGEAVDRELDEAFTGADPRGVDAD